VHGSASMGIDITTNRIIYVDQLQPMLLVPYAESEVDGTEQGFGRIDFS